MSFALTSSVSRKQSALRKSGYISDCAIVLDCMMKKDIQNVMKSCPLFPDVYSSFPSFNQVTNRFDHSVTLFNINSLLKTD